MSIRRLQGALYVVSVVAILVAQGSAQTVPTLGVPPFSSVTGGPDQINLSNLAVHYSVPVFSRPGHGLPFSFSLNFDNVIMSQGFNGSGQLQWMPFFPLTGGGLGAVGAVFYTKSTGQCHDGGTVQYNEWVANSFMDAGGTTHPVHVEVTDNTDVGGGCNLVPGPTNSGGASDGSLISVGLVLNNGAITATVTLPNGDVIKPPVATSVNGNWGASPGPYTITDSNGNQITAQAPGGTLTGMTDTLNSSGADVLTVTGGPWPASIHYNYTAPSGGLAQTTRSFVPYNIQTAFGCPGVAEYSASNFQLLDRITLPDKSYYAFTYEKTSSGSLSVTGRIESVTLPTGAMISYTYTGGFNNKGIFCADGSVSGFNRQTPDGTWKYSRTLTLDSFGNPSTSTNTITDPLGNQTEMFFGGNYETDRQIFTGTMGGTPIEEIITCYNGVLTNCPAATASNITTPTEITTFRSLNGGAQAEVDTTYNGPLVKVKTEYDFGVSTPSRTTSIQYASLGNGILDRPSQITVTDGGGNLLSQTVYNYDEDANSLQPSGALNLVSVTCTPSNLPCRGNPTTVKSYINASTYLTKTYNHYDTGQVYQATDVNSAVTTYTYGGCNHGLLTNIAMPLSLSTSSAWSCDASSSHDAGGVVIQATDANGKSAYSNYTLDQFYWRPESTQDQAGNPTSFTYTGLTRVESVLSVVSGSSSVDIVKSLDTLARPILTQTRQAPGSTNFDTVQQTYDAAGRPFKVTMPCAAALGSGCSTPATQTLYDGMGRVQYFKDGSGTTVTTTSYTNNNVYTDVVAPTGENDKRRQMQYDGLGRLTSVCEIISNQSDPYYGQCSQTNTKYGYWTQYAYGFQNGGPTLTVTQNTQKGPVQTRTYTYDALGRLTLESNPETGTTQYFYDSAPSTPGVSCPAPTTSTGDLVKKYDAQGNTICYQYDALHRLTAVYYPGGPDSSRSVQKHFVYDSALISTYTLSNTLGRLSEGYTGPSTGKVTDLGFSYSARGEVTDVYESTPHSGGFYHVSANYFPHGLLNTLNLNVTGVPTIYYGGSSCGICLDGEGRILQVTASGGQNPVGHNGATGVTYTTSGTTQPIGSLTKVTYGSGDFDSFSYDTNTGRMNQYQFSVGTTPQTDTGGLTWNANGSLNTLAITDQLNTAESHTCNYIYDDLGRISQDTCAPSIWGQTFTYDPFGNASKTGSSAFTPTYTSSPSTNQYSSVPSCVGGQPAYNLNGDPTNDCEHQYTWNADNRPTSIDTSNSYTYDALGRLVELVYTGGNTEYLYSPTGQELAMMNGQTLQKAMFHLPGGGTAIYKGTSLSHYRHGDWLGSARLSTTQTQTLYYDVAYAPFGETYSGLIGSGGNTSVAFAGQGKDTTTDLYPFLFRQYNSIQSRWVSPDPGGLGAVSMGNPQSWNRYAYVGNGPLNAVDPTGLDGISSFFNDAIGAQNQSIDISFNAWSNSETRQTFGAKYYFNLPGNGNGMQQGLGSYASSIYGNQNVRFDSNGWEVFVPSQTWTKNNGFTIAIQTSYWTKLSGSSGLAIAGALLPGMNGKTQAAANAAKNFMKHLKSSESELTPGDWEPPATAEGYLDELTLMLKDALDNMSFDFTGYQIVPQLMIDPNLMGCAGYGGLPCNEFPTSF